MSYTSPLEVLFLVSDQEDGVRNTKERTKVFLKHQARFTPEEIWRAEAFAASLPPDTAAVFVVHWDPTRKDWTYNPGLPVKEDNRLRKLFGSEDGALTYDIVNYYFDGFDFRQYGVDPQYGGPTDE